MSRFVPSLSPAVKRRHLSGDAGAGLSESNPFSTNGAGLRVSTKVSASRPTPVNSGRAILRHIARHAHRLADAPGADQRVRAQPGLPHGGFADGAFTGADLHTVAAAARPL